jgi:hypothetical protein
MEPQETQIAKKNDRLVYLRVKIKSLMAEASIIRAETFKAKKRRKIDLLNALTQHRKGIVRQSARRTFLAYGFLRGRAYSAVEPGHWGMDTNVQWADVAKMVAKYGSTLDHPELYANFPNKIIEAEVALKVWTEVGNQPSNVTNLGEAESQVLKGESTA